MELYREAAEQDYAPALCSLGLCYEMGDGVVQDETRAVEYYRPGRRPGQRPRPSATWAAVTSRASASRRTRKQAVEWFHKAADRD